MIKFTNVDQGIIDASRLMLTNDGLTEPQVDTYMGTHQAALLAAGRSVIDTASDIQALGTLRSALRTYLDDNPPA
jgi:hypothetical protein